MTRTRKPSPQTAAVLRALAEAPDTWRYGYELGQQVGLKAGSLYPILMRLADRELLEAAWEPHVAGRPPRHLYRLTGPGRAAASELAPLPGRTAGALAVAPGRTAGALAGGPGRTAGKAAAPGRTAGGLANRPGRAAGGWAAGLGRAARALAAGPSRSAS